MRLRGSHRVLLLETSSTDTFRNLRSEHIPFLLGLAEAAGWEGAWWTIVLEPVHLHAAGRYCFELPDLAEARLAAALGDWAPDLIVTNNRAGPHALSALRRTAGATEIRDFASWLYPVLLVEEAWHLLLPGGSSAPPPFEKTALVDAVAPRFTRRVLGSGEEVRLVEQGGLRLAVAAPCTYNRGLGENPCYAGLSSEIIDEARGCTFCISPEGMHKVRARASQVRTKPTNLALAQIGAHQREIAAPPGGYGYSTEDGVLAASLPAFLEIFLAGAFKPSTLSLKNVRADHLLAARPGLERLLPALRDAGHKLRLVSIGAESFSDEENARFNKGLTADEVWACYDAVRELEAAFPNTFACEEHGVFACILFTPWTRPADLRCNLEAARRLGGQWLGRVMATRLQIWPSTPIEELARADKLLIDEDDPQRGVVAVCMATPDDRELPWRFRDPITEAAYPLLVRLSPDPLGTDFEPGDALLAQVQARVTRLPEALRGDLRELASRVLDAAEHLGAAEILAHAFPDSELSEEPVPATPATGGDTEAAERQARAVKKAASALHRLSDSNPELLHGYQTTAVGPSEQHEKGVRLSFERDGEVLVLEIAKRFEADQIWVASPRLKVDPVKGATRDDEREIAQAALDAFEAESGSNELL